MLTPTEKRDYRLASIMHGLIDAEKREGNAAPVSLRVYATNDGQNQWIECLIRYDRGGSSRRVYNDGMNASELPNWAQETLGWVERQAVTFFVIDMFDATCFDGVVQMMGKTHHFTANMHDRKRKWNVAEDGHSGQY